jgi:hypothetical protein
MLPLEWAEGRESCACLLWRQCSCCYKEAIHSAQSEMLVRVDILKNKKIKKKAEHFSIFERSVYYRSCIFGGRF